MKTACGGSADERKKNQNKAFTPPENFKRRLRMAAAQVISQDSVIVLVANLD